MESIQLNNIKSQREKIIDRGIILITWATILLISISIAKAFFTAFINLMA